MINIQNLWHLVFKTRVKYLLILANSFLFLFISSPVSVTPAQNGFFKQKRLSIQTWNQKKGIGVWSVGEELGSGQLSTLLCSHPPVSQAAPLLPGSSRRASGRLGTEPPSAIPPAGQGAVGALMGGRGRAVPGLHCPSSDPRRAWVPPLSLEFVCPPV